MAQALRLTLTDILLIITSNQSTVYSSSMTSKFTVCKTAAIRRFLLNDGIGKFTPFALKQFEDTRNLVGPDGLDIVHQPSVRTHLETIAPISWL
jgi:hypothetical protein